jgi:cyanamide hydratase
MSQYPPGFQPVPRDPAVLPYQANTSVVLNVDDLVIPDSQLITKAKEFLRPELGEDIWNHSHRAFLFGK